MATVIGSISLIVHIYSVRYMAEEAGYARFFVLLDIVTATLLVMVSAGDLISLLIAWRLTGVLSTFCWARIPQSPAHRHAFWTLIAYRCGDLPLVFAAGLLHHAYGTWSLPAIFTHIADGPVITAFSGCH